MRVREWIVRHAISPYGLVALSLAFFLFSWTFPPATYTHFIYEPDLMYLDPGILLFFLLCVLGFTAGLVLVSTAFPSREWNRFTFAVRFSPMCFLLLPVLGGTVLTVLSCVLLVRNNENLLPLLIAGEAAELKSVGGMDTGSSLGLAPIALMGIVWWAAWRKGQLGLAGWRRFVVALLIGVGLVSTLVSAVLRFGRGEFMPILVGTAIVFLLGKLSCGELRWTALVRYAIIFLVLVVVFFSAFSLLRGSSPSEAVARDVLSYSVASYNRLAALLDGRLRYPYAGKGIYLSSFVAFNDTFNRVFGINTTLSWPDFTSVWQSEFGAVTNAGLNGALIWSGTFGYIFSDLGWFSPLLLFVYGVTTGCTWKALHQDRALGVVLYPWFAFCVLFWFGTNYLTDTKLVVLLVVGIALGAYEYVFLQRA
jgi:hypothetical protein